MTLQSNADLRLLNGLIPVTTLYLSSDNLSIFLVANTK